MAPPSLPTPTSDHNPTSDETTEAAPVKRNQKPLVDFNWTALVEYTKQHYVAIYSVLGKCGHEFDGQTLTIYTGNAFYKKKLDDTKYRVSITKSLIEIGVGDLAIDTIPAPAPPKDSVAASVAAIMGGGEEVSVES